MSTRGNLPLLEAPAAGELQVLQRLSPSRSQNKAEKYYMIMMLHDALFKYFFMKNCEITELVRDGF